MYLDKVYVNFRLQRHQTHWLQVIHKSLLGKAPPYLSSLVTIAAPLRPTHSSRYISLVIPKANTNSCQGLERSAKITEAGDSYLQSSSQITAHSPSVKSPSNYLIPILYLLIYLAPLHPSISTCTFIFCTSTIPVFNCYIVITSPPWPIYCLNSLILPHLHSLYIDLLFSFVLLYY